MARTKILSSFLDLSGTTNFGSTATGLQFIIHATDEYRINAQDSAGNGFNSVHIRADGTDGLFIEKDTNDVSIGTTTPDQKFHVEFSNTDTSFSGGSGGAWGSEGIRIENTSSTSNTMAMLHLRNNDADIHIAGIRQGTDDSDLGFFFEGSEKVRFTNGGKVGIGTTSPASALDVRVDQLSLLNLHRPNSSVSSASTLDFSFNTADATEAIYARIRADVETNTNSGQGGDLSFHTANAGTVTEVMRITEDGNVAIGTTSATSAMSSTRILRIQSSGNNEIILDHTDGSTSSHIGILSFERNGDHLAHIMAQHDGATDSARIAFNTQATGGAFGSGLSSNERMCITSVGRVGIGTTSPDTLLHVDNATDPTIRVEDTDSGMKVDLQSNGSTGFVGTTTNSHFAIRSNNTERIKVLNTGAVSFNGAYSFPTSDGSANQVLQTDGSGALSFATISSGSSTSISDADGDTKIQVEESSDEDKIRFDVGGNEKMRINSSGQVSINDTSDPDNAAEFLQVRGTSNSVGPVAIRNASGDQSFYRMLHYYKKEETSPIGTTAIDITGSAISHTFLSDERLKDELGAADGMNLISQLKPIKFKFKDGTGTGSQGFTAQAFKQAFDNVGSYARGVVVPDNADEYWYLDDKVLIPNLVKALQEQQVIIDDLKARIEALESG